MNIRMLVPVSRAVPTALRRKKHGSKNVTAAGCRGYVDGTNEKLSHAERCADSADHSKNKPNPRSSCSLDIWTPSLTRSRRGGGRGSSGFCEMVDTNYWWSYWLDMSHPSRVIQKISKKPHQRLLKLLHSQNYPRRRRFLALLTQLCVGLRIAATVSEHTAAVLSLWLAAGAWSNAYIILSK